MTQDGLRSARAIREQQLQDDPTFRDYWERNAIARAVALRIIGYRLEHQLTQTQLARMLGVRQPAVARLEAGEHAPSLETLLRLSGALGIEFLVHVVPTNRPPLWPEPQTAVAKVIEKVQSATRSSEATVAAT